MGYTDIRLRLLPWSHSKSCLSCSAARVLVERQTPLVSGAGQMDFIRKNKLDQAFKKVKK